MNLKKHLVVTSFATILLLLSIVLPHHHHGDAACFAVEICHDSDAKDHDHDVEKIDACIVETQFIPVNDDEDFIVKLTDRNFHKQLISFLSYYLQDYYNFQPIYFSVSSNGLYAYQYPTYFRLYSLSMGLRAPPSYA